MLAPSVAATLPSVAPVGRCFLICLAAIDKRLKGEKPRITAFHPAEDNTRNGEVRFLSLSPGRRHAAVATEKDAFRLVDLETDYKPAVILSADRDLHLR